MGRYLPLITYLLAVVALLFFAGAGAAGNWRGALRYMAMWFKHVAALAAVGVVLALVFSGVT